MIASLYDPLGLVIPVMAEAKLLFQEICKEKIEWDEELPEKCRLRWKKWLNDLEEADTIVVDRSALGDMKSGIK